MIDVNWDSTTFISASADSTVRLWDVQTGRERHTYQLDTPSRSCAFGYDGNVIFYTNDDVMGKPCEIHLADIRSRREWNEKNRSFVLFSVCSKRRIGRADQRVSTRTSQGDQRSVGNFRRIHCHWSWEWRTGSMGHQSRFDDVLYCSFLSFRRAWMRFEEKNLTTVKSWIYKRIKIWLFSFRPQKIALLK